MSSIGTETKVVYSIPYWRIVRMRMLILSAVFAAGFFSQYLLALYAPSVWNWFYRGVVSIVS